MTDIDVKQPGLVVAAHGRRGILEDSEGNPRPYVVRSRQLRVVCGDRVNWQPGQSDQVTVEEIDNRHNALRRLDTGRHQTEILAANLSLLAVVCAKLPEPDWFVLDRYLCAATDMGARSVIVVNKSDTGTPETEELENYQRIGYQVLQVSALAGTGLQPLAEEFSGQTGILVGQSGVGKTSLINCLIPGTEADTATLSRSTAEGKHTTTASVMHRLPGGGRLIDAPGVRDFLPVIDATADVQGGFPEISAAASGCRFANCRHLREPQCAVKGAMEAGEISPRRYESYRRMLRQTQASASG